MEILNFDEVNKYQEVRTWVFSQSASDLMRKKKECVDMIWDLLEYLYMLGYDTARAEVGGLATEVIPLLPEDYMNLPMDTDGNVYRMDGSIGFSDSTESDSQGISHNIDNLIPIDRKTAEKTILKKIDGKDFRDRVREYAELGQPKEIMRVVETDGNRIYNNGGLNGAMGIAKTKTWHTMMDDRVRDEHSPLEGIKVGMDEDFYTWDGDHAPCPGEFEAPENNINCRCWLTFN